MLLLFLLLEVMLRFVGMCAFPFLQLIQHYLLFIITYYLLSLFSYVSLTSLGWILPSLFFFFLNVFFIRYFLPLHFKLSQFPLRKSPIPSSAFLPKPPTHASWPCHSPVHIIFARQRASPPIDGQLGHLLLHMQLKTQLGRGYWLVHIVEGIKIGQIP